METPSVRVLESWREHAKNPYEFFLPRYVLGSEYQCLGQVIENLASACERTGHTIEVVP